MSGEGVPAGRRFALFPLAQELPSDVKIAVVAVDHAGNRTARTPQINIKDRVYPNETIVLSQRFLDQKIADLAGATGVNDSDKLKAFQEINTRIREENEEKIRELIAESAPEPLFTEAFEQMPDSQVHERVRRAPRLLARRPEGLRVDPLRLRPRVARRARRSPRRTRDACSSPTNSASTATA